MRVFFTLTWVTGVSLLVYGISKMSFPVAMAVLGFILMVVGHAGITHAFSNSARGGRARRSDSEDESGDSSVQLPKKGPRDGQIFH